jgi:O-antigen/teichoic acid export membrane protein
MTDPESRPPADEVNRAEFDRGSVIRKGLAWLSLAQLIKHPWEFGIGVALARLLTPNDFGLYALALVFYGLCQVLSTFGLSNVIVQREQVTRRYLDTAQSISLILGVILCALLYLFAGLIARFTQQPDLQSLLYVLSFVFIVNSFSLVPTAILTRQMKFHLISGIEIGSSAVYGIVSVAAAAAGYGVWSLVFGPVASLVFQAVAFSIAAKRLPTVGWDREDARGIVHFGSTLTAASLMNHLSRHLDYLLIGRILGAEILGIYKRAYDLATLPKDKVMEVVARVFLPSLTDIRRNKEEVKKLTLGKIKLVAYLCLPALLGLFAVADEFIAVVYGEKWLRTVGPLKIMLLGGVCYVLTALFSVILIAYEKRRAIILLQVVYSLAVVVGVLLGSRFGLVGVSCGVLGAIVVYMLTVYRLACGIIDLSLAEFVGTFRLPLLLSVGMALCVLVFPANALGIGGDVGTLFVKTAVGVLVYGVCISFISDPDVVSVKRGLLRRLRLRDA